MWSPYWQGLVRQRGVAGPFLSFSRQRILLMMEKQALYELVSMPSGYNLINLGWWAAGAGCWVIINMICINYKKNPKLLETYNNDPYSDITIRTAGSELHLVLGYLSIDSTYFDQVAPDAKEIDLSHLPEGPLVKILRSLYGEELYASTVGELAELYHIIDALQIAEYRENIISFIREHPQLMDSFELIEFCFTNHVLEAEIRKRHYELKLSVLASTKNYLQLNKLSQNTLNAMLLEYKNLRGEEADAIINSIIQNYMNRNDLRPGEYFLQPGLQPLLAIWEKFHHSITYLISAQDKIKQSQYLASEEGKKSLLQTCPAVTPFSYPSAPHLAGPNVGMCTSISGFVGSSTLKLNYQTGGVFASELEEKESRIKELETEVQLKDEIIETLQKEIENAKVRLMAKRKSNKIIDSDEEVLEDAKKYRKDRELQSPIALQGDYDVSLIEPPLNQARKVVNDQIKDTKTMNKLNQRARKIFN